MATRDSVHNGDDGILPMESSKIMQGFLEPSDIIDFLDPTIQVLATKLRCNSSRTDTIAACFRWVRDEVPHSFDVDAEVVTCKASEVLAAKTGICYAKSHLLAALLRANQIPAGLGYQRLCYDDEMSTYCLHGFNYVSVENAGWIAIDPRGNPEDIFTEFDPPNPSLAFAADQPGECTFAKRFANPLQVVVDALTTTQNVDELKSRLPDWDPLS